MRVEFSRFVESDLEEIGDWIAAGNPRRAISFIQEIRKTINEVGGGPLHYQLRPEIGPGARLAVVGKYVILFRIVGEIVRIERVVHGNRQLSPLFRA